MTLTERLEQLPITDWLALNQKLQAKKRNLRDALHDKGVIQKDKTNNFDKYSYLSEAGYKKLMTELLPLAGLDFHATQEGTEEITGTNNMSNGKRVVWKFTLYDTETGFGEESLVTGEAFDRSDKAIYKADTGAIKYWIANNFLVASGDDAENDSPEYTKGKAPRKQAPKAQPRQTANPGRQGMNGPATEAQKDEIFRIADPEKMKNFDMSKLTFGQAQAIIDKYYATHQQAPAS